MPSAVIPKKRTDRKKPASAKKGSDPALRARVKQLEAENAALRAHIQQVKVKVEAKFRELQNGVARRLESERGVSERGKVGIMDYLKQGFFTALGVIAAFAVVDAVTDGIEELAEPDLESGDPGTEPGAEVPEPDFELPDLEFMGGGGKRKHSKAPKAPKAPKAREPFLSGRGSERSSPPQTRAKA